jgi:type I restriction enzyme S subunit
MASNWPTVKLGDVIDLFDSQRVPLNSRQREERQGRFPYYGAQGVIDHIDDYIFDGRYILVAEDGENLNSKKLPLALFATGKFWVNNHAHILRGKPNIADDTFLLACLNNADIKPFVTGAAQPKLSQGNLRLIEIPLPPVPVQQCIASILSAYDELIENSQCRIKILETMARSLYREAILDVSTELQGVSDCKFWSFINANVASFEGVKKYYATADIDGLAISGKGINYTFSEKPSRAQKQPVANSVWFARMKETYKIAWYSNINIDDAKATMLSSGFGGFMAIDSELWPLLFITISSSEFHAQKDLFCSGATQMALTNEGLRRIIMPIPIESIARQLGRRTIPILNQILTLQLKIENLRRTRDLLLPRLLSGQIKIDEMGVDA